MGILVSWKDDHELYKAIYERAMRWKSDCSVMETAKKPGDGSCIKGKAALPAKPEQPYCNSCYTIRNRYRDANYEERYCHMCGVEHTTALLKLLCVTYQLFEPTVD